MIASRQGGSGDTALVYLHGGSGSSRLGDALLAELDGDVRWWAVDLPGHGLSTWTPGKYDLESVGEAIAGWAAETLPGPAWWYGHSYGGHIALAAVGKLPTKGLILGDPPLSPQRMYAHFANSTEQLRQWQSWCGRPYEELVDSYGATPVDGTTFAQLLGPRHPYILAMADALHHHDPSFLETLATKPQDIYQALDTRWLDNTETFLLRGDPAMGGLTTDEDAKQVTESVTIDGIGHELHHAAPAQVAAQIRRWLCR